MSVVLHPANHFTVVRQIANHLDSDTNYVRAVIRNAYTDEIIATLNLDDKGGQRFKKDWLIPADPSGQGFYISIVTSVYSDSGYSTKNSNYGDEENTYQIIDRTLGGGSGGGVDSRTLRRIIQEELDKREPEPITFPPAPVMPTMRFDEVLSAVKSLETKLKPEKPEKVEFKPLIDAIADVKQAIAEKEVTEVDLSPILEAIAAESQSNDERHNSLAAAIEVSEGNLLEKLPGAFEEIANNIEVQIAPAAARGSVKRQPKEEEEEPLDIDSLAI